MNELSALNTAKSMLGALKGVSAPTEKRDLIQKLKVVLLNFKTLPPSKLALDKEEFLIARTIIEEEMDFCLSVNDGKKFELAYLRIKQFYFDHSKHFPVSERKLFFVGIYLLFLLANHRTTDFSTELELLEIHELNNELIMIPREVEKSIMEGNYNHIYSIKASVNIPYYNYYLDQFDLAIRFQIARSAEKSYQSLKISDALKLLNLNTAADLTTFIRYDTETHSENREIDWLIQNDRLYFVEINKEKVNIPSHQIIEDTINLAYEIEKII